MEHFPGAVLVPGFINSHTHLELTGLEGVGAGEAFPDWIRTLIHFKHDRTPLDYLAWSREGLRQSFAAGVTTVADTGDSGAPFTALLELGGSGIAYLEVFGPDPATADAQLEAFRARIEQLKPKQTDRVRLGLSPHAPYSVSGPLYRKVVELAAETGLPIAVHVAESAEESRLLGEAAGAFANMWQSRGIPLPALPGRSPLAWLDEHGVLGPTTLCIHAVQVDEGDVTRLAQRGAAVAHCPRSNREHGHGTAPLGRFLQAGIRTGVGTDSVVSVHPLDLLAEARAAAGNAGLSAGQALGLILIDAAAALGLSREIGSLEPGKWADCAVIRLPAGVAAESVEAAILASGPADVLATFIGGRPVYRRA